MPLTSVRRPRRLIGRTASEPVVEEAMRPAGHGHRHVLFAPELVVREPGGRVQGLRLRRK